MVELRAYSTPQDYLDATLSYLEEREIVNNLPIGLCTNFTNRKVHQSGCHFVTCFRDGVITASSVKTWVKAIVTGTGYGDEEIQLLADYYHKHDKNMQGVVGETSIANAFAHLYHSGKNVPHEMIAHELRAINPLPLSSGSLEPASIDDIDLLTDWYCAFNDDVHSTPKQSKEELKQNMHGRIAANNVVVWRTEGKLASIAAIVRKTSSAAIIGIVYTPEHLRGRGYATSIVWKLTEKMLSSGFTKCGLFTETANPISNSIYKKIGYNPICNFTDILFQ